MDVLVCAWVFVPEYVYGAHSHIRVMTGAHEHGTQGLDVPFNWDGAVELNLGEIYEHEGNAVRMHSSAHLFIVCRHVVPCLYPIATKLRIS